MHRALQTNFFPGKKLSRYIPAESGTLCLPIGKGALRLCPVSLVFVYNAGVKLVSKETA
jgi:hypothetical protein